MIPHTPPAHARSSADDHKKKPITQISRRANQISQLRSVGMQLPMQIIVKSSYLRGTDGFFYMQPNGMLKGSASIFIPFFMGRPSQVWILRFDGQFWHVSKRYCGHGRVLAVQLTWVCVCVYYEHTQINFNTQTHIKFFVLPWGLEALDSWPQSTPPCCCLYLCHILTRAARCYLHLQPSWTHCVVTGHRARPSTPSPSLPVPLPIDGSKVSKCPTAACQNEIVNV